MKNLKYLVLLLILMLPIKVGAAINLKCSGTINPGKTINCQISSTASIVAFEANLFIDSKVIYDGTTPLTTFVHPTLGTLKTTSKDLNYISSGGGTQVANVSVFVPATLSSGSYFALGLNNIRYKLASAPTTSVSQDSISLLHQVVAVTTTTTTKKTTTTQKTTTTTNGGTSTSKTFTVTFNANNGSNSTSTDSCTTTGKSCKIDLTKAATPSKVGYTFNGWGTKNTCIEGNKTSYDAESNITLYACWLASNTTSPTTTTTGGPNTNTLFLNTLKIAGQEDFIFSKHVFEYELKVLYEVTSLEITAEPVRDDTVVSINEEVANELALGENVIVISLADPAGNTSAYTIKVTRLNEGEEIRTLSSDANLKSLKSSAYQIPFSAQTVTYDLKIKYGETTIPLIAEANDPNATVEIIGNQNLTTGSIIKVVVTAEDGITTLTYQIKITVKSIFSTYLLYFILGGTLLLAIIAVLILRMRKKKPKVAKPAAGTVAPKPGVTTKLPPSATPKPTTPVAPPKVADPKSNVEVLDI